MTQEPLEENVRPTIVDSNDCDHGSGPSQESQESEGPPQMRRPSRWFTTEAKFGAATFGVALLALTALLVFLCPLVSKPRPALAPAAFIPSTATSARRMNGSNAMAASLHRTLEAESIGICGVIEKGVRFDTSDFKAAWRVASKSWGGCCSLCEKDVHCEVWTWIQHEGKCALGTLRPTGLLARTQQKGSASGRSTRLAAFAGGGDATNDWGDPELVIRPDEAVEDVVAILVKDKAATHDITSKEHKSWEQTQQALEKSSQELGLTDQGHEELDLEEKTEKSIPVPRKTTGKQTASLKPVAKPAEE